MPDRRASPGAEPSAASALLIGAKTYSIPAGTLAVLHALDWIITLFFLAEILVRMIAEGSLPQLGLD